jgi:hypothetical protein
VNSSIGPPSGTLGNFNSNDNSKIDSFNSSPNKQDSYKNPWTTVSRPMNGFIDINPF